MIADLAIPLTLDRQRTLAAATRHRSRATRWLLAGSAGLLFGIVSLGAGAILAASDDPSTGIVGVLLGVGPLLAGIWLVRASLPHRWRAQAFRYAALFAEVRGAVSAVELARLVDQPIDEVAALVAEVATSQRLGWTPPPAFGVCDPTRYAAFRAARVRRARWLAAASFPILVVSGFFWILGLVAFVQLEIVIGLVLLLAGFGPGIPGLVIASRAVSAHRDRDRVGRLAIALLAPSIQDMEQICRHVEAKAPEVRALARAALQAGVLGPEVGGRLGLIQVQAPLAPFAPQASGRPAPLPASAWPGRLLKGLWLVEAPLGAGGMGTVFRGRDVRSGQPIAIKIVSPDAPLGEDAFRRFHREAQALATLRHAGIVRLHDYDRTEEGMLYLVMDLLEGETLEALLQRAGKLPLAEALSIASQIGAALGAAHAAGLLHRDVKPSNVFVARGPDGPRATLIDFGLVKAVGPNATSRVTTRGQVVGTPLYMSPEQARGDAVDPRSDLFALAVLTYEMVTGVPPFFDPSIAVVYAKLLSGQVPSLANVGAFARPGGPPAVGPGASAEERLDATLQRALAPLASDRHPSVLAFVDEIVAIGAAAPGAAHPAFARI